MKNNYCAIDKANNLIIFKKFKQSDIDLFTFILNKYFSDKNDKITITYSELFSEEDYFYLQNSLFNYDIQFIRQKINLLANLQVNYLSNYEYGFYNIFESIIKDSKNQKLILYLNRFALKKLINFFNKDTQTLKSITTFHSKYSIKLLSYMLEHKNQSNYIKILMSSFKTKFNVSKSYSTKDIDKRILNPVKKDLSHLFHNFQIKKINIHDSSHRILAYQIIF